jgi:hypothetical protein
VDCRVRGATDGLTVSEPFLTPVATQCEDRGAHELKGVPGEWQIFAVTSP